MTAMEILTSLKEFGSEQTIKTYTRHGVGPNQYGVSYGNLGKLKKKVKKDHTAALELWQSGNHDARIFATMIADPGAATEELMNEWVRELDNYVLTDAFAVFASKSEVGRRLAEEWRRSTQEWISTAGWNVLAISASQDIPLNDEYLIQHLSTIAATIHTAPNRTRYSMNNTLIAIGARNDALEKLAITTAEAIGKVEVDHGDTGCKTPDAAAYIRKTRKHKAEKLAKASA